MRGFVIAWAGQLVSMAGSATSGFALAIWVYRHTGSVVAFAFSLVCNYVPGILIAPLAGSLADRLSRKMVLLLADSVAGLAMCGLAVSYLLGGLQVWQIYGYQVIASVCLAFQWPAFSAALTLLVEKAQLGRANGMMSLAQAAAGLLGPLLAGALLGLLGLSSVIIFDVTTFVVAVSTMAVVGIPRISTGDAASDRKRDMSFRSGWRYITDRPGLLGLVIMLAVYNSATAGLEVLITPLVLSYASVTVLGTIASVGGAGMVVGGLLMSVVRGPRKRVRLIFCAAAAAGCILIVAGLRPGIATFIPASFGFFFCLPIINSCSQTIWQTKVSPSVQGRVFSLRRMIAQSCVPGSYLLFGALVAYFDRIINGAPAGLFGHGSGRGAAFLVSCLGLLVLLDVGIGFANPRTRRVESELPDMTPGSPGAQEPDSADAPPVTRSRWAGRVRRTVSVGLALALSAGVLVVLADGYGTIPALGQALDPGHGVWQSASYGAAAHQETLHLAGLSQPVQVSFSEQGLTAISAKTDASLFLALGYVEASLRLTEMDLERRQAEGRLAQLVGPAAIGSDEFELRLGLLRTAQQGWADMPKSSPAAQGLIWYSRGVNDYLAGLRADGKWPTLFSLAGVYPSNWTPVDSLAVQGDLTQELGFTTTPLDYELLERSLGAARTMSWFPVLPANQQSPYDPGPYSYAGITPIPAVGGAATEALAKPASRQATAVTGTAVTGTAGDAAATPMQPDKPSTVAVAAAAILAQTSALPPGQLYSAPASNSWAANGPKVAGGGAMLAGDPHLPQTLPSIWFQVALSAPGYDVSGVGVPGLPALLIGHNADISWSITDTQSQSTLYYVEQTSKQHPGEYFWRGAWRQMQQVRYTIPVRGGSTRHLTVDLTVHGPVLTLTSQTVSVDWMGALPSTDLAAIYGVGKATDFAQFKAALAGWVAPTLNFVYADHRGNIGAISAGYYPQVVRGEPWLPMPGTGADDVAGVAPYRAVPQVYDPPGHVIATANQRPVTGSYPYYIGTSANFFDPGYRADEEYAYLGSHNAMKPASFTTLQLSLVDPLASQIVPRLLSALGSVRLTATQAAAEQQLADWDDTMAEQSSAASIWWTFWSDYLAKVFQPWWSAAKVPVHLDTAGLQVGADQFSLDEVLQKWTLTDPGNLAFTPPGGSSGSAASAMRAAFITAVNHLASSLGPKPDTWAWGRLHARQFPSLTGAPGLGYGPRAAGGDPWTVDAAEGDLTSNIGPSWRMIVAWDGRNGPVAEGIYPGGQSESPYSTWYTNLVADWWNGKYMEMTVPGMPAGPIRWELQP
jgi:penicillin G amidase